jgi:beta-RFAP synthase
MIEEPALRLEARVAKTWSAEGRLADEVLDFAKACRRALGEDRCPPLTLRCHSAPPRHAGFGSGTQLGLAVATLVSQLGGAHGLPIEGLARWVGRGQRSGIGVHGFARGGFLVEAGKLSEANVATPVYQREFPESWRVVLVLRLGPPAIHGALENRIFHDLQHDDDSMRTTEVLCRILLLGVLPSLEEQDYSAFGESLYEFNRKAGERFASKQGGIFAAGAVSEIIESFRKEGCVAVGQSSWGPAVYAICSDEKEAARVASRASQLFPTAEVHITRARNCGASLRSK